MKLKNIHLLLWIAFTTSSAITRLHPSTVHRRFHHKKNSFQFSKSATSSIQSTELLPATGLNQSKELLQTTSSGKPAELLPAASLRQPSELSPTASLESTELALVTTAQSSELLPTVRTPIEQTNEDEPTAIPSTTITSTNGITFQVGNHTINNLENTLDDIAPSVRNNKPITEDANLSTTNPFTEIPMFDNQGIITEAAKINSTSNVILEVINIAPYFKGRSKYSKKFVLIISLYATLAISCIVIAVCLVRGIAHRNRRHRQYMLLTKKDLEFPLGGGGI